MANARDQMKTIEAELQRVRSEIDNLRVEEALLLKLLVKMGVAPETKQEAKPRSRSANVKPVVLDVMREAGALGMTTADVDLLVREKVPTVAKDTVGSVLSRLKSDGALIYDGERYYERQLAPKPQQPPFDRTLRAVT